MEVKFNNKKQIFPWSFSLALTGLLSLALLGGCYLLMDQPSQSLQLGLWAFFILILLLYYLGGFCYLDVQLSDQKIDVKFYKLMPIGRQYRRILLPVDKIKSLKVARGIGPVGRRLVISGRLKGRTALFPAVGLAACTRAQLMELENYAEWIKKGK